jgi:hypothetical protein
MCVLGSDKFETIKGGTEGFYVYLTDQNSKMSIVPDNIPENKIAVSSQKDFKVYFPFNISISDRSRKINVYINTLQREWPSTCCLVILADVL